MSEFKETYDGCKLVYDENKNHWTVCEDGEECGVSESLKGARAIVDRLHKAAKTFKRVEVLSGGHYRTEGLEEAVLTSLAGKSRWSVRMEGWVTVVGSKERSKVPLDDLILATPESRALEAHARKLEADAEALEEEARKLRNKMPRLLPFLKKRGDLKEEAGS